jgi:hypothetical protein
MSELPRYDPVFPSWARSTPETLLLGRSPVNSKTCSPDDLGRKELLNLGPGAGPGCFGPSGRLLELLRPWRGRTDNAILADFLDHLERRQAEVEAYTSEPVAAWTQRSTPWIGFYERLRRTFPSLKWDKVSNARGGFVGAWWRSKPWTDPQRRPERRHQCPPAVEAGQAGNRHATARRRRPSSDAERSCMSLSVREAGPSGGANARESGRNI